MADFPLPQSLLQYPATIYLGIAVIATIWLSLFAMNTLKFHRIHQSPDVGKVPPTYPSLVPYLGIAIPLLWNPRVALERFASYNEHATVTRLSVLPGICAFIYQDPNIIRQIWRQSSLTDFRPMSTYFHTKVCGMSQEAASKRLQDPASHGDSSLKAKRNSEVSDVHRVIVHGNRQGLTGQGLSTTIQRYKAAFARRTHELVPGQSASNDLDGSWTEFDDLWDFIKETAGASEVESIFGPTFTRMHPTFIGSFFEYAKMGPWILKGMPTRGAAATRRRLLLQFRAWRAYAKDHFTESAIYEDGGDDPFWGSAWTRYRHREFASFFDEDAMASHDLSVAWGSLENTIPCALLATFHVLQDTSLTSRVRHEIDELCGGDRDSDGLPSLDPAKLASSALLSSIYAETLRLHVSVSIPVIPMHGDLILNQWRVPKGSFGLISTEICHKNKDAWNTKDGTHRLDRFWAERFIVDSQDPLSGPAKPGTETSRRRVEAENDRDREKKKQIYFTTEGLEGCWIPYGGGKNVCPGRFLAKSVIQLTFALLVTRFDIEFPSNSGHMVMESSRFGLGSDNPAQMIPCRIRRKK